MVLVKRAVDGRKPESEQVSAEGRGHPDAEGLWEAGGRQCPSGTGPEGWQAAGDWRTRGSSLVWRGLRCWEE